MPKGFDDKDRGYKRIKLMFEREGRKPRPHVLVGLRGDGLGGEVHQDDTGEAPLTMAEIGSIHEFGLGFNPERSFIRASLDENTERYVDLAAQFAGQIVDGTRTTRSALELLGGAAVGDIQARINAGIPPPNADVTIERKGGLVPLVDTGQMKAAIDFKVEGA